MLGPPRADYHQQACPDNDRTQQVRVIAMSMKAIFFALGCILSWFVLLPVLMIGGGIALFAYAIFAELGALITGHPYQPLDTSAAREIARRMCAGYGAQRRDRPQVNRRVTT